jgi:hypothetical protein
LDKRQIAPNLELNGKPTMSISVKRNSFPAQDAVPQPTAESFSAKKRSTPVVGPHGRVKTTAEHVSDLPPTEKNLPEFGKMIESFSKFLNKTGKPVAVSPYGSTIDAHGDMVQIKDKNHPHLVVSYDVKTGKTCCWDISSGEPKQLKGKDAERAIQVMKKAAVSASINPNGWKAA